MTTRFADAQKQAALFVETLVEIANDYHVGAIDYAAFSARNRAVYADVDRLNLSTLVATLLHARGK